jgi:alpha-N-arabinofuranosidase
VPYLKLSAVHDEKAGTLTLFALNRDLKNELKVDINAKGFQKLTVKTAHQLHDRNLKALNTRREPNRIGPKPLEHIQVREGELRLKLAPASWNVIQLRLGGK